MIPYNPSPLSRVVLASDNYDSDSDYESDSSDSASSTNQRRDSAPDMEGNEDLMHEVEVILASEMAQNQEEMEMDNSPSAYAQQNPNEEDWQEVFGPERNISITDQMETDLVISSEQPNGSFIVGESTDLDSRVQTDTPPPAPRMQERQLPVPQSTIRPPPGFESFVPMRIEMYEPDSNTVELVTPSSALVVQSRMPHQHQHQRKARAEEAPLLGEGQNWKDPWFYNLFRQAKISVQICVMEHEQEQERRRRIERGQGGVREELSANEERSADDNTWTSVEAENTGVDEDVVM